MKYLLDTNTCIFAMKGVPAVVNKMIAIAPSEVAISSITCYELYTGVEKCGDPTRERAKVNLFASAVTQLAFDSVAADCAAKLRAQLESRGEMIGPYDVLIAG